MTVEYCDLHPIDIQAKSVDKSVHNYSNSVDNLVDMLWISRGGVRIVDPQVRIVDPHHYYTHHYPSYIS